MNSITERRAFLGSETKDGPKAGRRRQMLRLGVALALTLATVAPAQAATTRYVWTNSPTPTSPYTNWAKAAHTIQDAVDAAQPGDTVLVTNGVYASGGRAVYGLMTNRVAGDKAITVLSASGPAVTIIVGAQAPGGGAGDGAIRCVYLTNGASLSGFTLTNGATRMGDFGGGLWCESTNATVSNCVLTGNWAWSGGGAYIRTSSRF